MNYKQRCTTVSCSPCAACSVATTRCSDGDRLSTVGCSTTACLLWQGALAGVQCSPACAPTENIHDNVKHESGQQRAREARTTNVGYLLVRVVTDQRAVRPRCRTVSLHGIKADASRRAFAREHAAWPAKRQPPTHIVAVGGRDSAQGGHEHLHAERNRDSR
jgi:hypothetical protein